MLKYLKQKGQKLTANYNENNKNDEIITEDDEYDLDVSGVMGDIFMYHSRLSMSLQAIVSNPNCLSYFIQYLERQEALPLIKFYLDIENFKIAALTQLEQERRQSLLKQSVDSTIIETIATSLIYAEQQQESDDNVDVHINNEGKQKEEHNAVPELKTLCESMCKPLTDDEKSQLCAANNKQLQEQTTCCYKPHFRSTRSDLSLCSETRNTASINEELKINCRISVKQVSAVSVRDAMAIYQKYLHADAKYFVPLPINILSEISLLLCKRKEDQQTTETTNEVADIIETCIEPVVSASCFDNAQTYVLRKLERDHLNDFLQSSFYCKYCIELIESNSGSSNNEHTNYIGTTKEDALNICDVLHSEVTLFFFMEFLEQRGERRECLDFWTVAINFRKSCMQQLHQYPTEMQVDAMIIYEKYISLQSLTRLRLLDKLRSHVEERICDDGDGVLAHCFDLPLLLVVRYLERKHLNDFLKSLMFQKFVNELKSKAYEDSKTAVASSPPTTAANTIIGVRRKMTFQRYNSNSTAHRPIRYRKTLLERSTSNTLLATMDSSVKHIQTTAGSTNLNIDSRQLTDPDLLWRRSSSCANNNGNGGLQFGYVNALGRYERDFSTVETFINGSHTMDGGNWGSKYIGDSNSTWSLKNAVRKLVHLPVEDKLQEEIAWQMAELIVRDVTNVTLRGANGTCNGKNKPYMP